MIVYKLFRKLKSGEITSLFINKKDRVWLKVEIQDYVEMNRPTSQGGKWYLANKIRILNE